MRRRSPFRLQLERVQTRRPLIHYRNHDSPIRDLLSGRLFDQKRHEVADPTSRKTLVNCSHSVFDLRWRNGGIAGNEASDHPLDVEQLFVASHPLMVVRPAEHVKTRKGFENNTIRVSIAKRIGSPNMGHTHKGGRFPARSRCAHDAREWKWERTLGFFTTTPRRPLPTTRRPWQKSR